MPRYARRKSYRSSRRRSIVRRKRRTRNLNKRRFRRSLTQNAIYYKVKRVITLSGDANDKVIFGMNFNGRNVHEVTDPITPQQNCIWTRSGTDGVLTYSIGDVPDLTAQYDASRIAGVSLKWYPSLPNGSVTAAYAPMAIIWDRDGIEGNVLNMDVPTAMEQANGVSIKNAYRPWKRYFKAPKYQINTRLTSGNKTTSVVGSTTRYEPNENLAGQWKPCNGHLSLIFTNNNLDNPIERATQLQVITEVPSYDDSEVTDMPVGTLVITSYLVFKDRK